MPSKRVNSRDLIADFRALAMRYNVLLPENLVADGKIQRVRAAGKHSGLDDYYLLSLDDLPRGLVGSWCRNIHARWSARRLVRLSACELAALRERAQAQASKFKAEILKKQDLAARNARILFDGAKRYPGDHPYLLAKGVPGYGVRMLTSGTLLVPMRDEWGLLHNVERISASDFSKKRGLKDGRRKGLFHTIGEHKSCILLCEGYATGASLHLATGEQVVVAFNATNLSAVALALRCIHPEAKLIIAADDDWTQSSNPGLTEAAKAAARVGATVARPVFSGARALHQTDFNDLYQSEGPDAVRKCIFPVKGG